MIKRLGAVLIWPICGLLLFPWLALTLPTFGLLWIINPKIVWKAAKHFPTGHPIMKGDISLVFFAPFEVAELVSRKLRKAAKKI